MTVATRSFGNDSHGVVLIIVAMLATILLMFAAIVVDLTLYANSREQAEYNARKAVLASLAGHFGLTSPTTSYLRVQAALNEARQVVGQNVMLSDRDAAGDATKSAKLSLDGSTGATLEPGIWYNARPGCDPTDAACLANPPNPCAGNYPCFVSVPVNTISTTDDSTRITAYRVTGPLYSGITARFARGVFGVNQFPVNVKAVSSVVPRQGCFLIDISGSMMQETHRPRSVSDQMATPRQGLGRSTSFTVSTENSFTPAYTFQDCQWNGVATPDASCPWTGLDSYVRPNTDHAWAQFLGLANDSDLSLVTKAEYQRMHFGSDYQLFETLSDADYPNLTQGIRDHHPAPSGAFAAGNSIMSRVDTFRKNLGDNNDVPAFKDVMEYHGAEPLRTVFAGLRQAVTFFKERQVAGDAMCLIFYDKTTSYTRYVKMTNNFDYLLRLTNFDDISSLTPPAGQPAITGDIDVAARVNGTDATGFELLIRHRMLPMGPSALYTNTFQALTLAMNELTAGNPQGGFASNFITLIGDGLGNCMQVGAGYQCGNTFDTYNSTQQQILNWVRTALQNRNIPIHWILVGQSVAPHTLRISATATGSGTGPCMTDKEARAFHGGGMTSVPMVKGGFGTMDADGNLTNASASCKNACTSAGDTSSHCVDCRNAFANMDPTHPFVESNVVPYEMAAATRGVWGPIRPSPANCVPRDMNSSSCGVAAANWQSAPAQTTDPDCASQTAQINNYMAQIIGGNPIALVEVE
ncbi:MAG: hypothetical protein U0136_04995 [Bdellovibrionota bacterium]